MKKIISILMAVSIIFSMCYIASAADIVKTGVQADIKVKTTSGTYQDSLSGDVKTLPEINTKATLDMSNVRNIVKLIAADKLGTYNELKTDGYVKATIDVTIKYSDAFADIDASAPKFSYSDGSAAEGDADFIYNVDSRTPGTETGYKTILIKLSTNELKLSDLVLSEESQNGDLAVKANGKLGDIVLSNESVKIAVPAFDEEYEIKGDIKCTAEVYTRADGAIENTPFKTYEFTGEDKATIKYTEDDGSSSSSGVGGGSSVIKVTVKSSHPSGEVPAGTKVKLTATPTTAKIYYTTDGTEPSVTNGKLDGTTKLYSSELVITEDTTVKAIAVSSNGKTKSDVETWEYTVTGVDVSINPKSGIVKAGTEVTISTNNGKDIYYTTDGTEPALDENGAPVGTTKKYTDAFVVAEDVTIKAIAVNEAGISSVVAAESYKLAPELTGEHIAYIKGYPDGEVKPDAYITRAEVAKIFSRLTVKQMDVETTAVASFTDVSADAWYASAVAFMEQYGIVKGYEDGSFKPDNYITRAEFAAMASRFDNLEDINENIFDDVTTSHWAFFEVNSAYKKGWVNGYPDSNNFLPDNRITRAEAVTIVNRMTGRNAKAEFENADLAGFIIFPDAENIDMHWAFYDIVESSNDHDYE